MKAAAGKAALPDGIGKASPIKHYLLGKID